MTFGLVSPGLLSHKFEFMTQNFFGIHWGSISLVLLASFTGALMSLWSYLVGQCFGLSFILFLGQCNLSSFGFRPMVAQAIGTHSQSEYSGDRTANIDRQNCIFGYQTSSTGSWSEVSSHQTVSTIARMVSLVRMDPLGPFFFFQLLYISFLQLGPPSKTLGSLSLNKPNQPQLNSNYPTQKLNKNNKNIHNDDYILAKKNYFTTKE